GGDGEGAIEQVKGGDLVGDINNLCLWIDLQDDALEHAHEMVVDAVVGGQGNDWIRQESLPLEELRRLLNSGVGRHTIILTLTEDAAGCKESGGKRCKSANGEDWGTFKTQTQLGPCILYHLSIACEASRSTCCTIAGIRSARFGESRADNRSRSGVCPIRIATPL